MKKIVKEDKPKLGKCKDCRYSLPKGTLNKKGEYFMGGCDFWTPEVKHPDYYFLDHECENGYFEPKTKKRFNG